MTIAVYLQPEVRVCDIAQRYASGVAGVVPASLVIGDHALAHITLVHLDGVDSRADEVWGAAKQRLDDSYTIEGPFYLSVVPFPDGSGHNFVRVEVSRTDALDQAQQAMLALAGEFGAQISNLAGPAWRPHVTLAVIDELPSRFSVLPDELAGEPWPATPALGSIGPFRHVDRLLRS